MWTTVFRKCYSFVVKRNPYTNEYLEYYSVITYHEEKENVMGNTFLTCLGYAVLSCCLNFVIICVTIDMVYSHQGKCSRYFQRNLEQFELFVCLDKSRALLVFLGTIQ